ncbi:MAG: hypothetical protein WBE13_09045 [Candidatus Acidiferrum sp.]
MGISDEGMEDIRVVKHDDISDATRYSVANGYPVSKGSQRLGYAYLIGFFLGFAPWVALYGRAVCNGIQDLNQPGTLGPFLMLLTLFTILIIGIGGMIGGERNGVTATKIFLVANVLLMLFGLGVTFTIGGQLLAFIAILFSYAVFQGLGSWLYLKYSGTVKRIYGV